MPVLFAAVIASVQDLDAVDLNQEHCGTEHVARSERRKLDAIKLDCLVVVDRLNFRQRILDIFLVEKLLFCRRLAHLDKI